jgi:hypothetical protein
MKPGTLPVGACQGEYTVPHSMYRLKRRDFIKTASAGLAAFPALGLLDPRSWSPAPSRVALVRTVDRKRGVAEVLRLLDLRGVAGKRVVLKPNFNSADETPRLDA